jgi:hypothetical protein
MLEPDTKRTSGGPKRTRKGCGSAIAEFGPVLWLFLILIVIPFLDLISFATAVGTVMMMADFGAKQASGAMKGTDAYNSAQAMNSQLGAFLAFSKCSASPGITVQVQITKIGSATPTQSYALSAAANVNAYTPYSATPYPTDSENPTNATTTYTYQYLVTATYQVMPLFNFGGIPWLKTVPALGSPVTVTYTGTSNVEHPEGLNQ